MREDAHLFVDDHQRIGKGVETLDLELLHARLNSFERNQAPDETGDRVLGADRQDDWNAGVRRPCNGSSGCNIVSRCRLANVIGERFGRPNAYRAVSVATRRRTRFGNREAQGLSNVAHHALLGKVDAAIRGGRDVRRARH